MAVVHSLVTNGSELWDKNDLLGYGTALYREHSEVRNGRQYREFRAFQKQVRGVPEFPTWASQFVEAHRRFLSCVGWVRYLKDRGLKDSNVQELLGKDTLLQAVAGTDSDTILKTFLFLESSLRLRHINVRRTYAEFDPPGLPRLVPEAT